MEKDIIRKYIEEVINTGNIQNIGNYIDEMYIETYNEKRYPLGIKGATEHILGVRKTYPDLMLRIKSQISEGEWVATSYVMAGTHAGEWMGIPPTNKKVRISGVNLNRVVNGKIVEHSGAANLLEPLLEIGAIEIIRGKNDHG